MSFATSYVFLSKEPATARPPVNGQKVKIAGVISQALMGRKVKYCRR